MIWSVICLALLHLGIVVTSEGATSHYEYCIIGAGPGGLQLGYFLHEAGRNYVIFERSEQAGSFFLHYPRHRRLISINKVSTGRRNPQFNERHDWNSLLTHKPLFFHNFSREFFPRAESMVQYLNSFARLHNLNVLHNTNIVETARLRESLKREFVLTDHNSNTYTCRVLIVATGMALPNIPKFVGSDLVYSYSELEPDKEKFQGQNVLILGRGNSAFETADEIYGHSNLVHMIGRSRVRLAWSTHYVGDLRAVNNGVLDTYQLKSLDGLLEASVEDMSLIKMGNKIMARFPWETGNHSQLDNYPLRQGYDSVISCLGFRFNHSIFTKLSPLLSTEDRYPAIKHNFESRTEPDLFFIGASTHSLDYRRSAGGFIHGFRYTTRALHRLLEWKYERTPWPNVVRPISQLLNFLIRRMNEAAGPYQMFDFLCDVIILEGETFKFVGEFPMKLLPRFESVTGHRSGPLLVMVMQYGRDFSGPGHDTFRMDRAIGDPLEAHQSNFLHPVFYFYNKLPSAKAYVGQDPEWSLPRPDQLHHVLEDFMTDWTAPVTHILPLRRFLESCSNKDLKNYMKKSCLKMSLTYSSLPVQCERYREPDIEPLKHLKPSRLWKIHRNVPIRNITHCISEMHSWD